MLKRLITAFVALGVFIPTLIFSHTIIFPLVMSTCALFGCYEMISCLGMKKNLFISLPILICAIFFPLYMRYCSTNADLYEFLKLSTGIFFVLMIYSFGNAVFNNKNMVVNNTGLLVISCIYIIASFTSVIYIRDYVTHGKYLYLIIFLGAWITDSFAYFSGRVFGKHKLIPQVSPKKTVEGAIGGVCFCVISILIFGFVVEQFFDNSSVISANYLLLAVSGIFISIVSQIGDLIMSVIKRHYNIKDYGKIFPGHGGVLDRFDSVLPVSLILAVICTYFNLF